MGHLECSDLPMHVARNVEAAVVIYNACCNMSSYWFPTELWMQVKPIKLTGAAAPPPPLAVRPPVQPLFNPSYLAAPYGTGCEGWPQMLQQPAAWGQQAPGSSFTFVPTPTSTPNPGPDQGSMPFSYPRRPVLPAFCSAWQIPAQVQLSTQAQELAPRCRSAPTQPQPLEGFEKPLETHRSADASFDLDSVLDSEPLYLGEDSDLFDSEFGDIFGSAETQQHDVLETAAKLEALVTPGKISGSLPFGLRLKKSESFVNLINKQLAESRSTSAAGPGSQ